MHPDLLMLNSKIALLEAEMAENTLLFGQLAEMICQVDDSAQLIGNLLERISILKNIPFCACLTQSSDGLHFNGLYTSFPELNQSEIQISLPEINNQILNEKGFLILNDADFESFGFSILIPGHSFHPASVLIISCFSKNISNRFFVFLDNSNTSKRFPELPVLLLQIVQLVSDRLEKEFIFSEITRSNQELNQQLEEKTDELNRTNRNLKREIYERRTIEKALNLSEKKLRSVYKAAIDVSFITFDLSEEFRIRSFSTGAEKMFGYHPGEVIGKPLELFQLPNQADIFPDIRQNFENQGQGQRKEVLLRRKSGEYFTSILTIYPLFDEESKLADALAVCIDISDLKQTQDKLIQAKEKAEESDRLKTSFLQNISHEIRTPLNAILGFSDLLPEYFDDEEKLIRFTNLIKQKGGDLLEIINDVLVFARIESGQIPLYFEACQMNVFLDDINSTFQEYQSRFSKDQLQFKLNVSPQIKALEVLIDKAKLKQILMSLIGNALKFTSCGKIELGCTIEHQNVFSFYVSDTGMGIPKEKQTEIYDRFIQSSQDTSKLYGGTGLGLSIVKGLLSQLGGEIWLESEKGQGSIFSFTMPFKSNYPQIQIVAEDIRPETRNLKILIVEDDEYNTMYLHELLSDTEFTILPAKFGKDAIRICSRQTIDLIIVDLRISDISGYQMPLLIRKQNPDVCIFAQTSHATADEEEKALAAGYDDYLSKPVRYEFLLSRINFHLKPFKNHTYS